MSDGRTEQVSALIGFGTNRPAGTAAARLRLAATLAQLTGAGLKVLRCSGLWRSLAWPEPRDPPFVNAVIVVDVPARLADPDLIYPILRGLEVSAGRARPYRWAPRPLDLDLLDLIGGINPLTKQWDGPGAGVEVPHPRAHQRAFVLAPLVQVCPEWTHPKLHKSAAALLAQAPDRQAIWPIALAGGD